MLKAMPSYHFTASMPSGTERAVNVCAAMNAKRARKASVKAKINSPSTVDANSLRMRNREFSKTFMV
ncbi:hypothetical protein D3C79_1121220 [compost metagenome]